MVLPGSVRARLLLVALVAAAAGAAYAAPSFQQLVIHKQGTDEYHRPWCPVVRDARDVLALTLGQANARRLKSHADCEQPPAGDAPAGTGTSGQRPAAPVFVYMDGTKYYHRDKCAKSSGPLKRVTLDAAGRTQWPCPACRPPVRKKSDGPAVPPRGRRR